MSTIRVGGVKFRLYPQDHEPVHAHGRCGSTIATVELHGDRTVSLMRWPDLPAYAKRSDVRKILDAAAEHFDAIIDAWEKMH